MARKYSNVGQRTIFLENGLALAAGLRVLAYKDSACTQPANLAADNADTPGAPLDPSLLVDGYSMIPEFWDLDDLDRLYVVGADSQGRPTGPVLAIEPDSQPQIAELAATRVSKGEIVINVADYGATGNGTGNDAPAISAAIAAAPDGATVQLSGEHRLTAPVQMRSSITLDGSQGSLRQTSAMTPCVRLDGVTGARLRGIRMRGVGTDYVGSSAVYQSAAVHILGSSSGIAITDCVITNVAGGGVYVGGAGVSDVTVTGCTLAGPDTDAITPIADGFGAGVVLNASGVTRVRIIGNSISRFAQGIVSGTSYELVIANNTIHSIIGQHGIYLDATRALTVTGNTIRGCALQGVKVQIATGELESSDVTISGNSITDTGSHAILITNALSGGGSMRSRRVVISANTCRGSDDGIHALHCDELLISANSLSGGNNGIHVAQSTNWSVVGNRVRDVQAQGLLVEASSAGLIALNEVQDPAQADGPTTEFGLHLTGASTADIRILDNRVRDAQGHMRYGLYLADGIDQATITARGNVFTGATEYGVRMESDTPLAEWRDNIAQGGTGAVLGFPTSQHPRGTPGDYQGTAAPTTGTWTRGSFVRNSAPGSLGWLCTAGGSPGTWVEVAAVVPQDYLSTFGESPSHAFAVTSAVNVGAANNAVLIRIVPRRTMTITRLQWVAPSAGGTYDIGIYDSAGARLWSKGSTSWASTGTVVETVSPGVSLLPGRTYWIAWSSDSTAGTARGVAGTVAQGTPLDGSSIVRVAASAHPLPASLTLGSATTGVNLPLIILRES